MPLVQMYQHITQVPVPAPMCLFTGRCHFFRKGSFLLTFGHTVDEFPHLVELFVG